MRIESTKDYKRCYFSFYEKKLDNYICASGVRLKEIDTRSFYLSALNRWGKPDEYKVVRERSPVDKYPLLIWHKPGGHVALTGSFEERSVGMITLRGIYGRDRKVSDHVVEVEIDDHDSKKLTALKQFIGELQETLEK